MFWQDANLGNSTQALEDGKADSCGRPHSIWFSSNIFDSTTMVLLYYISGRRELTVQSFRLCSSLVYRREIMYRSQAPLQVCSNCKSSAVPDNHHQGPVNVLRMHSRFFRPNGSFNVSGTCRAKFAIIITKCKNRWVIMKS